jgi:hypothetical protein
VLPFARLFLITLQVFGVSQCLSRRCKHTNHLRFTKQPAIHEVKDFSALNESLRQLHDNVLLEGRSAEVLKQSSAYIDVRDLAEAHVRALKEEKAGGERIIVSAGTPNSITCVEWCIEIGIFLCRFLGMARLG